MRAFILVAPLFLAGCLDGPDPAETPDRAIRSFNGSTVVIQSKSAAPNADDLALAQTACPGARYTTTNFRIEGVGEYLYLC